MIRPKTHFPKTWFAISAYLFMWGLLYFYSLPAVAQNALKANKCQELERRLAQEWVQGNSGTQNLVVKLKEKVRQASRKYHDIRRRAERADCYEDLFIFGRSLRQTRRCRRYDRDMRKAKREYNNLEDRLAEAQQPGSRENKRDRIMNALARNNCGPSYRQAAKRRRSAIDRFFFGDDGEEYMEDDGSYDRRGENRGPDSIQPYATYRTMCVRLCDGFYFPVSFSTLPSQFEKDTSICQNKCAAPTRLFVYRNPGAELEQMISLNGQAYSTIKNAWKYRKSFVKGCSCKVNEYTLGEQSAQSIARENEWQTQSQKSSSE